MARLVSRRTGVPSSSVHKVCDGSETDTSRLDLAGGRRSSTCPCGPHGSSSTIGFTARHTFHSRGSRDTTHPGSLSSADSRRNERLSCALACRDSCWYGMTGTMRTTAFVTGEPPVASMQSCRAGEMPGDRVSFSIVKHFMTRRSYV